MLIDRTHRWWALVTLALAVTAVCLHAWLGRGVHGGLGGGSRVGLYFGLAGSLLMLFAGLLSAHRRLPVRWWVGKRQTWLRGHIWLGLLSVVLILCHANYRFGGPLEIALWVVLAATVLSGVFGLAMQIVLPRLITTRVQAEAPAEQVPHLCERMRQDADEVVNRAMAAVEGAGRQELEALHGIARRFLAADLDTTSPLAEPMRAGLLFDRVRSLPGTDAAQGAIDRLQLLCDERRQLGEQARLHAWLHLWLLAHVPLSVALLVLGVAHAVLSVYW